MKLVHLRLRNYRRYGELTFDIPDGVSAIIGRNGSGKSTILEAIQFALYGAPALRTNKELVRYDGAAPADPVEVVLELELVGQAWHIERSFRGRNLTPQASLTIDGTLQVPPGAGSADAVTQHVQQATGLGLEAFRTTLVAQQKELSRLADLPAAKRKQQILHMLGIDRLDAAIQEARSRRRGVEAKLEGMRAMLPDPAAIKAQYDAAQEAEAASVRAMKDAEANAATAQAALDAAQAQHDALLASWRTWDAAVHAVKQAENNLAGASQAVARIQAAVDAANAAAKEAQELEPAAAQLPAAEMAWQEAEAQARAHVAWQDAKARLEAMDKRLAALVVPEAPTLADAEGAHANAQQELANAQAEHDAILRRQTQLNALGTEGECPTCSQPLSDHLPQALEAIRADEGQAKSRLARAQQEHKIARQALEAAQAAHRIAEERRQWQARRDEAAAAAPQAVAEPPEIAPLRAACDAAKKAHSAHIAAAARAEQLPSLQNELQAAQAQQVEAQTNLDKAHATRNALRDPSEPYAEAKKALENGRTAAAQAQQARDAAARKTNAAASAVEHAAKVIAQAKVDRQKVRAVEQELHAWTALVGARGGGLLDRFRDHMAGRIRPAIQAEAGRLLGAFTQGRYDEVILDDGYNLYVADGGVHYTLDRFSGGEGDLVHLALRLAVSRLLAERGGMHLGFLALDEVFGSLDGQRTQSVVAALQGLGGIYQQVLVVTHIQGLQEALDHVLEAVEDANGATLRLHNG